MAGVRGRSGGARPGAGRKKRGEPSTGVDSGAAEGFAKPATPAAPRKQPATVLHTPQTKDDTLQLLIDIAFGRVEANAQQVRAAVAAVQYTHTKTHDGGKKQAQQDSAGKAAAGRFGVRPPPLKLVQDA